jgi:hypothetical protein
MSKIVPRSPYDTQSGLVYFPRMLHKIRLHLAGTLPDDYRENLGQAFDAIVLQNCPNHQYAIDVWTGDTSAPNWKEVVSFSSPSSRIFGSAAASLHSNDTRISLPETTRTRALRFHFTQGHQSAHWMNA